MFFDILILAAPVIASGVFIAAIFAPAPRSAALCVISFLVAFSLSIGCYLLFRNASLVKKSKSRQNQDASSFPTLLSLLYKTFRPCQISIALFHSSAIVIAFILTYRLGATEMFGGAPQNLDFGPKSYGDGINVAFTTSSTTFGHCLQGFLSSFLSFPAIVGILARLPGKSRSSNTYSILLAKKPSIFLLAALQLTSACMTIYPSYSLIKRLVKNAKSFSRTSHLNNTTEWVMGYFLGVGFGWCTTVLVQSYLLTLSGLNTRGLMCVCLDCGNDCGSNEEAEMNYEINISKVMDVLTVLSETEESSPNTTHKYGFGNVQEYCCISSPAVVRYSKLVTTLRTLLLMLLSVSTLLTGIFIGITWNWNITVLFTGIYVGITIAAVWFSTGKWPFHNIE